MGFERDYFDRFYGEHAARSYGPDEIDRMLRAITAAAEWLRVPIASVLDAGAGTGMVRDWFRAHHPTVAMRSTDTSEYACATYGHERHDLARWCDQEARFDLIVCKGVFGYLSDDDCASAAYHLSEMCGALLYFSVVTDEDISEGKIDGQATDLEGITWRPRSFYERVLAPHFGKIGLGLFYRRGGPVRLLALERGS